MTNRPPLASRWQNSSSHQSIDCAAPAFSRTAGSAGSPNVPKHRSAPLVWIRAEFIGVSSYAGLGFTRYTNGLPPYRQNLPGAWTFGRRESSRRAAMTLYPQAQACIGAQVKVPLTVDRLGEARQSMVDAVAAECGTGPEISSVQ